MNRLQRLDQATGSRERTHAFLESVQGNEALTISYGNMWDNEGGAFGRLRSYFLINADSHTVPQKGGVFAWSEEPRVTMTRDQFGVNKDATAEAVYYDTDRGGGLKRPKVRLIDSLPYIPGGGFRPDYSNHITAGTIILDGDDPLATIAVEQFPRGYEEYHDVYKFTEVKRFTLTMGAAGMLVDQLNATKHPIVPAFTKTINAVL